MMKKIILMLMVSLILVSGVNAQYEEWADNQFGNHQASLGVIDYFDMTQYNNTVVCIPFRAGETGTILTWYFNHNSTGGTKSSYCIDTALKHPNEDSCVSGEINQTGYLGYPFANDPVFVNQNTMYYFCYTQNQDAGGTITLKNQMTNTTYGGDLRGYYDVISPYSYNNKQFTGSTNPQIWLDYKVGASWNGWTQTNHHASGVGYCYNYSDDCYVVSYSDEESFYEADYCAGGTSCNQQAGIYWLFPFEDNTVDKIKFQLVRGATTPPSYYFKVLVWEDSLGNEIYSSPSIPTSILEPSASNDKWYHNNYTLFIHNVVGSLTFRQNHSYYILLQMQQGGASTPANSVCFARNYYDPSLIPEYYNAGWRRYYKHFCIYSWVSAGAETGKDVWWEVEFDDDLEFIEPENETYTQCNDGIDNDLDGFTDYPSDPSCYGILDNDESPVDYSEQEEDDCLVSLGCVIYDSIPYADSPFLHDWYGGQESDAKTIGYLGGYSIDLDTVDEFDIKENVIIFKDNQNTNNYNTLDGEFVMAILEEDTGSPIDHEPIYVGFLDDSDNGLAWIMLNVSADSPYDLRLDVYAYDGNQWVLADYGWVDNADNGFLRIEFELDEANDEFQIRLTDFFGLHSTTTTFDYDNSGSGQIAKAMVTNTLDDADAQVLLHSVELIGRDVEGLTTTCTTWDLPYHLKENFNGYMSECDWNVDPDIFFYGDLALENEVDYFMIYKIFDYYEAEAMYYDRSRYGTVRFDLTVYDDSDSPTGLNLYLYDLAFSNVFVRLFFKTDGDVDAVVDYDTINIYSSLTLNQQKEVMVVVDLVDDEFDFYYDGVLRASDIGFHDEGLNVEYFNGIYFQSGNSHYSIDNLYVFESEADGEELTAPTVVVTPPDATKPVCKLFRTEQPECNFDSDCDTDKCLVNGKCSRFDNTYCDDNKYTRGNMCIISGISYCAFSSIGNIILDNFWLFLIFLIVLMIFVYLAVIFTKK